MNYETLFSEGNIGSLRLTNRIVMTAMETDMAEFNGNPSDLSINYFYQRARGGAGLIITGITRVNDMHGVSTPRQLSLAHNYNIKPMKRFTDIIHRTETKIFCQLHHPGRQTYSALMNIWPIITVSSALVPGFSVLFRKMVKSYAKLIDKIRIPSVKSSSAIECSHVRQKTSALTYKQVRKLIGQFISAARRAQRAGFDGVELHAAHGYLLQQFLSTRTNKRDDEFGGSLENRCRFLTEILSGIKHECGETYPVSVRVSVDEFYNESEGDEKGITLPEGIKICRIIKNAGADALNISSAGYETMNKWLEPVSYTPGWRAYLAKEIKKHLEIPVIAANLIRSPQQAEQQLQDGIQDFAGFGRPFLVDPYWPKKAYKARESDIKTCINCLYCFESLNRNAWSAQPLECARNPLLGREDTFEHLQPDGEGHRVLVIGAGPAGLSAAEVLSRRGFDVTVFEKAEKCGGQVSLAGVPPKKERITNCISEMEYHALKNGAKIKFNCEVDINTVVTLNPEIIVYAAGSSSMHPPIPGIEQSHVFTVEDVLSGKIKLVKSKVLIAGSGMTGLETAEFLAEKGNEVVIVEMEDKIGPTAYHQNLTDVLERLRDYGVSLLSSVRLEKIDTNSVLLQNMKDHKNFSLSSDAVVLSLGNRSNIELLKQLKKHFDKVIPIGDAISAGRIADSVRTGYEYGEREVF